MYDFIMGATMMMEMGMLENDEELTKGLGWFRKNNEDAYNFLFN